MSDEVVESIKRFLDVQKKSGVTSLQLDFFGGEPTLRLNTVYSLARYAKNLFSDPGDEFWGGMTTNGVCLDLPTFRELNDVGVNSFQITIAGPKAYHDTMRIMADGSGSYDAIMRNLEAIRQTDLDFSVVINVHVTPENCSTVARFAKEELALFQSDPLHRFKIIYPPVVPLGGKHDSELTIYPSRKEAKVELERLKLIEGSSNTKACFASRPDSIVVLPDGKLSKCTVELGNSVVGQLFPDGTIQVDPPLFDIWCKESACPREAIRTLNQNI